MTYSRWATEEEIKEVTVAVDKNSKIKKSGLALMYDENHLYIKDDEAHSLIISSTGSGKTQTTLLPQIRLATMAQESMIVNDVKGEIYERVSGELKKENYNIIVLNIQDCTRSNLYNPLQLPYRLYKNGKSDDAIELLDNLGSYIFGEENPTADPCWTNSSADYFVGLALYLFENATEEQINLNSIYAISQQFELLKDYVQNLERTNPIYMNLAGTILAPTETKGSILSVFSQKLKLFVSKENLSSMLSKTDFDITNIQKEKTAIFIINDNKLVANRLITIFIEQCFNAVRISDNKNNRRLNIFLDTFDSIYPIKCFNQMISIARSSNIKFYVYIKSLIELKNLYGAEMAELLKISFGSIVYLLANDIETLEEISNLCGKQMINNTLEPLITPDELKTLNKFETIILIPRMYPIKTKFISDYQIDWDSEKERVSLPENKLSEIDIYKI